MSTLCSKCIASVYHSTQERSKAVVGSTMHFFNPNFNARQSQADVYAK